MWEAVSDMTNEMIEAQLQRVANKEENPEECIDGLTVSAQGLSRQTGRMCVQVPGSHDRHGGESSEDLLCSNSCDAFGCLAPPTSVSKSSVQPKIFSRDPSCSVFLEMARCARLNLPIISPRAAPLLMILDIDYDITTEIAIAETLEFVRRPFGADHNLSDSLAEQLNSLFGLANAIPESGNDSDYQPVHVRPGQ